LADELRRRVSAGSLVFGVFAGAEGESGYVECHREMGWLLFLQQQDEHRDEAVDGIGVLAFAVHKTVHGEGVERPERQRMAVDYQDGRLFVVRHPASLAAAGDSTVERNP